MAANGGIAGIGAGVFLTGGTSRLVGIDRVAQAVFRMPVQSMRATAGNRRRRA